jgi:hypothetical protein
MLSVTATASAQENRAPMVVVIMEFGGAGDQKSALEAECARSAKIDLRDSRPLEDALAAVSVTPLETAPKQQQLVAQMMREQGVETIIVIEPGTSPTEYKLTAISPSGKPRESSLVVFDKASPEYNRQISSGLTRSFSTVAPEVLAAREQRPKQTAPAPPPEEKPKQQQQPAVADLDKPEPPGAREEEPTDSEFSSVDLFDEEATTPSASAETSATPAVSTKKKTLLVSAGPSMSLLNIGLYDDVASYASLDAQNPGISARITARNPLWLKSLISVDVDFGRSTASVTTVDLEDGQVDTAPTTTFAPIRNFGVRANLEMMLLDFARLELGPTLGLGVQRDKYLFEPFKMTTGIGGVLLRIPLQQVLLETSVFGEFGSVEWDDRGSVLGWGFDIDAALLLGTRIFLRPGLRTMYHTSQDISSNDFDVQGNLDRWTFTGGLSLGWSI